MVAFQEPCQCSGAWGKVREVHSRHSLQDFLDTLNLKYQIGVEK